MEEYKEVIKSIESTVAELTEDEQKKFLELKTFIEQSIVKHGNSALLAIAHVGASLALLQDEVDNEGK